MRKGNGVVPVIEHSKSFFIIVVRSTPYKPHLAQEGGRGQDLPIRFRDLVTAVADDGRSGVLCPSLPARRLTNDEHNSYTEPNRTPHFDPNHS